MGESVKTIKKGRNYVARILSHARTDSHVTPVLANKRTVHVWDPAITN